MLPCNWDIYDQSGKWHEARNQPEEVLDLFKGACTNRLDPKIVILAPVKCETYVQTPESCDKLIKYIKEKYAPLLAFLQGRSDNIAVVTAPVKTVGCLHFWRYEIKDFTRPRFWFRKTSMDAAYAPENGDELLRYLLSFVLKISNDQTLAERSPVLRSIRNVIGHHTPFEEALNVFANNRQENKDGFTIIQGRSLLIPRNNR